MNSVRSLMGDVSFHGMATPPRCAMLSEAVTHVAGLRCYPCRRTVPSRRLTRGCSGPRRRVWLTPWRRLVLHRPPLSRHDVCAPWVTHMRYFAFTSPSERSHTALDDQRLF